MRVVSVLPSATEIVFALGHGHELVGRSAECDFPPEATRLPAVMRPRVWDAERSSAEIDARVRAVRGRDESLYDLDIEALRRLEPDLLLTQDLCSVCSVTDAEVAAACARADVAPRIVSLSPRSLGDVWLSVDVIGRAVDDPRAGRELSRQLRERARPPVRPVSRPTVAVLEWLDPPILAGLWSADIVRAAGAVPIGPKRGRPGERTSWTAVSAARPDLLVLSPCSFSVARTLRELNDPALAEQVGGVEAPRGTFVADEAFFSRPGPRLADGVDLLRNLLAGGLAPAPMPFCRYPVRPQVAA